MNENKVWRTADGEWRTEEWDLTSAHVEFPDVMYWVV